MLAAACPRQTLRELDLNAVTLRPEGAATLGAHPSFANVESLTLNPDVRESQLGVNLLRFARECAMKSLRSFDWKSYSITAANNVALIEAIAERSYRHATVVAQPLEHHDRERSGKEIEPEFSAHAHAARDGRARARPVELVEGARRDP